MLVTCDCSCRNPVRRCHEFRTDRILYRVGQDAIDLRHAYAVNVPAEHVRYWSELLGPPCAPERDIHFVAIEHPANREMNHALAESLLREAVELLDGRKVLLKSRILEFRSPLAQIVAGKAACGGHAA